MSPDDILAQVQSHLTDVENYLEGTYVTSDDNVKSLQFTFGFAYARITTALALISDYMGEPK